MLYESDLKDTNHLWEEYSIHKYYKKENIYVFSIPIFELKDSSLNNFFCKEIEYQIDFIQNPYFQLVWLFDSSLNYVIKKHPNSFIIDTNNYFIGNYKTDNLNVCLTEHPMAKQVYKYKIKNPDVFIFLINGLDGFWCIKNNQLKKFKPNFITLKKTTIGNNWVHKIYNEEYFLYLKNSEYILCSNTKREKNKKAQKKIYIKL